MKTWLAVFWFAFSLSPVAGAFAPGPDCALCLATEHAYCGGQGHDCSAHAPKDQPACDCDGGEAQPPKPERAPDQTLGHKCVQGSAAWFFAEGPRFMPLASQNLNAPQTLPAAAAQADFFLSNPAPDPQDRPPAFS